MASKEFGNRAFNAIEGDRAVRALDVAPFVGRGTEREAAERPAQEAPFAAATVLVCGLLVVVLGLIPGTVLATFARRVVQDTLNIMS